MSQDLLKQIDNLVESKTFNLDALDGIKQLKDDLKKTLDERDALQKRYDAALAANSDKSAEILRLTARVNEQEKHIAGMADLANKGAEAIWEKKVSEASAAAYKDALYTVFKPNAVRETVQRLVAVPVAGHPGGNGMSPTAGWVSQGTESETVMREDA
jgi:hypothetical protein